MPLHYFGEIRETIKLIFFTEPSAQPVIVSTSNTSASSVRVDWVRPHQDTIHGEFLGYKLTYRQRNGTEQEMSPREVFIKNPESTVSFSRTLQLSEGIRIEKELRQCSTA